ncbi:MAG: MBL fold metallo-hydrolase [Candidatus Kapaibacterium sp.]
MENPFGIRSLARGFQVTTPEVQFDTVNGRGPAIISHAHADHVAENPKKPVFASPPTADLLRARGHVGDIEKLEFGQWRDFDGWRLKLLPAGHILGSAQVLVERGDGLRLLYTGDMKTRRGRTCEMAEFEPADDLLTECTFGMPIFRFPPEEEVAAKMVEWARTCIADGLIPVFLGYSLGKGQEIMSILAEAGIPMLVHSSMWHVTEVYKRWGYSFGQAVRYSIVSRGEKRAWVIPPHVRANMTDRVTRARICYVSGWALMESRRESYRASLMAPISDHADYYELIDVIERVAPKRLWPVHGPRADLFAAEMGERFNIQSIALDMLVDDQSVT